MYFPVWIDECAPPKQQTMWMSLFFITEHLGIIIGYGLAFFMKSYWFLGFGVQAATMLVAGLLFMTIPKKYFDESAYKKLEDLPSTATKQETFKIYQEVGIA